jgi:hypothetical protein
MCSTSTQNIRSDVEGPCRVGAAAIGAGPSARFDAGFDHRRISDHPALAQSSEQYGPLSVPRSSQKVKYNLEYSRPMVRYDADGHAMT